MTRRLSTTLATIVEALELEAATIVTTAHLRGLVEAAQLGTDPYLVASRLAGSGWLLPTGVSGAWEFAPGARAGAIGSGDPFLVLRAQLAVEPALDARVALESSMWRIGIADRAPARHVVAVRSMAKATAALTREFRVTAFDAALDPTTIVGAPTQSPATTLVHIATSPAEVRNWEIVLDGLGDLIDAASPEDVHTEAAGRPNATLARLAYLIDPYDPTLARTLGVKDQGTVWFGPRRTVRRKDPTWNVADTVLPRSPSEAAQSTAR